MSSKLFSPLQLQNHCLPNRIVVSPMCQYSAIDGYAQPWHLVHLGQYAIGKAGLIMQEATAVNAKGRITYADLGIWSDSHISGLKNIVDFVHSQGSLIGIQLAHAGRKASTNIPWINRNQFPPNHKNGWHTVAPSPIPFHSKDIAPVSLSTKQIKDIIQDFRLAAERAVAANYDVIEIHAAHGYLIHQFLSPLTNQRTDQYGNGSFENRIRFLIEIIEEITKVAPGLSIWLRISATDWADGGWNIEESIALAKIVKDKGIEVIDVSTGGAVSFQKIEAKPLYQVPFAQQIKEESGMITGAVGLIKEAVQANDILENNQADFVSIGRAFLENPHLVYHFAQSLGQDMAWAPQYERGKESF